MQPKDVLQRPDVASDAVVTHGIDLASLAESPHDGGDPERTVQRFLAARAEALLPMIYATVGVDPPAPVDDMNEICVPSGVPDSADLARSSRSQAPQSANQSQTRPPGPIF